MSNASVTNRARKYLTSLSVAAGVSLRLSWLASTSSFRYAAKGMLPAVWQNRSRTLRLSACVSGSKPLNLFER